MGPCFLTDTIVQIIAAATPIQTLKPTAAKKLFSILVSLESRIVRGSENTNPGKKKAIPRSMELAKLLVCAIRPETANRTKRTPSHSAGIAIEHITIWPRFGLLKSSKAYHRGKKLANTAMVPSAPAIMRLAIRAYHNPIKGCAVAGNGPTPKFNFGDNLVKSGHDS